MENSRWWPLNFENIGKAVGISLIYLAWKQRYNGFYFDFTKNFTISGFAAAILEFWMVMDMPVLCHLIADIFRKSHQRISVYSMWFRNGSEKISLSGNFTPPFRLSCEG